MRALVCRKFGGPEVLAVEDVDPPVPGSDQVLVRVRGAGLTFADLVVLRGEYQERLQPPFIPGAEVFGEVIQVGSDVGCFRRGDLVMGQVSSGAYAEFVCMDPRRTVRLSVAMPAAEAAGFFINYGTAYSALVQRAHAGKGERVLVLGAAGGVGLAAVQIAKALGMTVIADCRGSAKQALVRQNGADLVVDYTSAEFRETVRSFTSGLGCDIVLDMIGGEATKAALKSIAWCGRLIIIGFTSGAPHLIPSNHVLVKNCSIIGHWWGDYHWRDRKQLDDAFEHLFSMYAEARLRPVITETLTLETVAEGLRRYADRTVISKLVAVNHE